MKFLVIVLSLLVGFSDVEVPDNVKSSFSSQCPDVDVDFVDWSKKWDTFIASYVDDETQLKITVHFNQSGKWLYTKEECFFMTMDSKIKNAFKTSKYANSEVKKVNTIHFPKKRVVYEFEVEIFDFSKSVFIDSKGQFIKLKL